MMKKFTITQGIAATAVASVLVASVSFVVVAANTSQAVVSASRAGVYSSLVEMRSDSDQVVVATVVNSKEFLDRLTCDNNGSLTAHSSQLTLHRKTHHAHA